MVQWKVELCGTVESEELCGTAESGEQGSVKPGATKGSATCGGRGKRAAATASPMSNYSRRSSADL